MQVHYARNIQRPDRHKLFVAADLGYMGGARAMFWTAFLMHDHDS